MSGKKLLQAAPQVHMALTFSSGLNYEVVDVFTTQRFCGNQLAIVRLPHDSRINHAEQQKIAREFNFSETVFLRPLCTDAAKHEGKWAVDIFTPDEELPFAGHPVIGAAWSLYGLFPDPVTLVTKAGPIAVTYELSGNTDSGTVQVTAVIPHDIHVHRCEVSKDRVLELQPALQRSGIQMKESFPAVSIVKGITFVLIELDSVDTLDRVATTAIPPKDVVELDGDWAPSFVGAYFYVRHGGLSQAGGKESSSHEISCRMIEGTLEDPATGSAAGTLAAYLAMALIRKSNVKEPEIRFHLVQGKQMGRESHVRVKVSLTSVGNIDKIFLSGSAVRVMAGRLS